MRLHFIDALTRRYERHRSHCPRTTAGVLLYHRIHAAENDSQWLCVSPRHFEEHLRVLRDFYSPLPLGELARSAAEGRIPRNALVVTFDDGYVDNLVHGKPLLKRYDIPATFFITSGQISQTGEFWWDEVERLILQSERLPEELELRLADEKLDFAFDKFAHYPAELQRVYSNWNVLDGGDPTERHTLYRKLCQAIKPLTPGVRENALRSLREWADDSGTGRISHRALSLNELEELASGGLCEIGAHTVNHPTLSRLSLDAQIAEIRECKTQIETILKRSVECFSYPYGTREDYTHETVRIVQQHFKCGVSNFPGRFEASTNQFEIPRFVVRNWDGETFRRRLKEWLNG